jgi:hypothetical protein
MDLDVKTLDGRDTTVWIIVVGIILHLCGTCLCVHAQRHVI